MAFGTVVEVEEVNCLLLDVLKILGNSKFLRVGWLLFTIFCLIRKSVLKCMKSLTS